MVLTGFVKYYTIPRYDRQYNVIYSYNTMIFGHDLTWAIPQNMPLTLGIFQIMWLKQCHVYHPPVITIFIGGINFSINHQKWGGLFTL